MRAFGGSSADPSSSAAAAAGTDRIVDLRGIILAYAGRVLMRAQDFYLERGHRYGLVGQNGVGKTTLLTRIAAGDIAGFPAGVRCECASRVVRFADDAACPKLTLRLI